MLQFVCDNCSAVKALDDIWILGVAAEAVGVTTARREVTILAAWDRERAVHPLAVHFCSVDCKEKYMLSLFDRGNTTEEVVAETTVMELATARRVKPRAKLRKAGRKRKAA